MTIEEFYQSCQNCGWKTEFELWSFFTLLYRGRFDPHEEPVQKPSCEHV